MIRVYIENWMQFIGSSNAAIGVPLIMVGLTLMFMGWQFYKTAVPFAFLLVGLAIGAIVIDGMAQSLLIGTVIGLILAVLSFFTIRYSVSVLGGICGSFMIMAYLSLFDGLKMPPAVEIIVAAVAFAGTAGMAFIMHREMIIIVTSLIGTILLVSGMDPVLQSAVPRMHSTVNAFLNDYPHFFAPFLVGGPTLIATLIQMAFASKSDTGQG